LKVRFNSLSNTVPTYHQSATSTVYLLNWFRVA